MPMMGSMNDYGSSENRREIYRAPMSDVVARVHGVDGEYSAKDLSAAGIGLDYMVDMDVGDPVSISIYEQGTIIATDVNARVAYAEDGCSGFWFDNIKEYQYDAIDSYVEEVCTNEYQYYQHISPYYV